MPSIYFLIFFISLNFTSIVSRASDMTFPSTSVKSLSVSISKGSIFINGNESNKDISVSIKNLKKSPESEKCIKKMGLEGTTLDISVSNENSLFEKASCEFEVTVNFNAKTLSNPESLIKLRTSNGAIVVKGVSSELDFVTATGNILVDAEQLRNVNVKTATGSQNFSFKACPKRADVDLITATGQLDLKLPSTCKIKVDFKSGAGKLFNPIGESADYSVKINATSASGDLNLAKFK